MTGASVPISSLLDSTVVDRWGRSSDAIQATVAMLGAPLAYHLFEHRIARSKQGEALHAAASVGAIENHKQLKRGVQVCEDLQAMGVSCLPIKGLANALSLWPQSPTQN